MINKDGAIACLGYLKDIDKILDEIDRNDPYGDMVQNFEDIDRERYTARLIKTIKDDLKEGYFGKNE